MSYIGIHVMLLCPLGENVLCIGNVLYDYLAYKVKMVAHLLIEISCLHVDFFDAAKA